MSMTGGQGPVRGYCGATGFAAVPLFTVILGIQDIRFDSKDETKVESSSLLIIMVEASLRMGIGHHLYLNHIGRTDVWLGYEPRPQIYRFDGI
jgi:hypothetical protein